MPLVQLPRQRPRRAGPAAQARAALYRTQPLTEGTPFALWIDAFWRLRDDPYLEGFVRDKLKTIRKQDGIVITSTP